jgi:hypothetical protein
MFFSALSLDGSIGIAFGFRFFISDAKTGLIASRLFKSSIVSLIFAPVFDRINVHSGYFIISTDDKSLYAIAFNANGNSSSLTTLSSSSTTTSSSTSSLSSPSLDIYGETKTPRRSHSLCAMFLPPPSNESVIIAGDKVGDVWVLPLPNLSTKKRHVLAHTASIITAVTGGGSNNSVHGNGINSFKYLVTADRDEKIRVSSWPRCFNVESYCLGHTRFISTLCLVTSSRLNDNTTSFSSSDLLVSGGGDGTLRLWHLSTGKLLHTLYLRKTLLTTTKGQIGGRHSVDDGAGAQIVETGSDELFEYSAEASIGAHSDGDMVDATAEAGGGGDNERESGSSAMQQDEEDEDQEQDQAVEEEDVNSNGVIGRGVVPHQSLVVIEKKAPLPPALVPLSLVELPIISLSTTHTRSLDHLIQQFAVFIEGEGVVRIISLHYNKEEGSSTLLHLSQDEVLFLGGKAKPQCLVVMKLNESSLSSSSSSSLLSSSSSSSSYSSPSFLLLVGTVEDIQGKILHQIRVFSHTALVNSSPSSSSSSSSSTRWVSPILSTAASNDWARRIALLNAELLKVAYVNDNDSTALFSSVLTAHLSEYDKLDYGTMKRADAW